MRTPMKASRWIQDPALPNCLQHPVQDTSPKHHARQNHKLSHRQTGSPQAPHHIPPHTALPVRGRKTHPLPPEHRHRSFPTRSLQKPLGQPRPPRAETKREKKYDPKTWEKETSNPASLKKVKRQRSIAQMKKQG